MKTSYLAPGTAFLGLVGVIAACGGSTAPDVLGDPGQATASSSGTSGASGTSGTSGTSGAASSSGTSGASSSSSSGNTSSTSSGNPCVSCEPPPAGCISTSTCDSCSYTCPDAGGSLKCAWTKDGSGGCPDGSYCDSPTCGPGVCVKKGQFEGAEKTPQCGCDGVTYWNASIAKKKGMAIRTSGVCKVDSAAFCGGIAPIGCPNGASCNMQVEKKAACNQSDGQGTCWGLPTTCPIVVVGGNARPCGSDAVTCATDCTAIRKGITWYQDNSCPQ